ncbi:MAG: rane protein [Brevibacillus sp.]|nr:rane protein [Brevibacillus sp.]
MNEFEHFISQLQQGAIWSLFTIIGYLFLLAWWVLFLFKIKTKNQVIVSK